MSKPQHSFPVGLLVEFSSHGNTYRGFIIGTCAYDGGSEPNAYVVRYVWRDESDWPPRKPYTIVDMSRTKPVKQFPEDFTVGDHWSATPDDRCNEWELVKRDGLLFVVPKLKVT